MKYFLLLIFLMTGMFNSLLYADQIVLKDGKVLSGKIISVNELSIEYTPDGTPSTVLVSRESALKIIYSNGKVVLLESESFSFEKEKNEFDTQLDWTEKKIAFALYPIGTMLLLDAGEYGNFYYFSFEAEIKLSNYFSLPCEIRYIASNGDSLTILSPGIRLYTQGKGIQGNFIGLYYEGLFGLNSEEKNDFFFLGNKMLILSTWFGYRWTWDNVYTELAAGLWFLKTYNNYISDDFSTMAGLAGISFGVGISF